MIRPRRPTEWVLCLAAALALAAPAAAQSVTSGALEGTVRSADGNLLTDASILLTDASVGSTRPLAVAPNGRFTATFLPAGSYDLLVERVGFAPQQLVGVPVRPGRRLDLRIRLNPASTAAGVDTVRYGTGVLASSRAGGGQWFTPWEVAALPAERYGLDELARLTSNAGPGLEVEGLPARMTGVLIDGVPFAPARRPGAGADPAGLVAFPLQVLQQAELVTGAPDVEWSGFGSGLLSGYTRRGTRDFRVSGFGSWGTGSLDGSAPFGPGSVSHAGMQGGVLLSGPIVRDTASFVLGVEARRFETPLQYGSPFVAAADSLVEVAQSAYGVALGGADARLLTTEVLSGFGRVDWQFSSAHALTVRANAASVSAPQGALGAWLGRVGGGSEGLDLSVAATLASQLGEVVAQEVRLGVERSRREPSGAAAGGRLLPSTAIASEGLELGSGGAYAGTFDRTVLYASGTLQGRAGAHLLKGGAAVNAASYEGRYVPGGTGEFFFPTLGGFARGEGYFAQPVGTLPVASFTLPRFSAYLQDTWTVSPGLDLLLGLRVDADVLPSGDVRLQEEWARLTKLANTEIGRTKALLGPRAGFQWSRGEESPWVVRGSAGIFYDAADPAVIGEVLANDGRLRVRRGAGTLGEWPDVPPGVGTDLGPTLTLLAEYQAPRSARGDLGVSRLLAPGTAVHLAFAYRRTELLPRRADLNLAPVPAATDQNGRPVFGTLARQGTLLFAQPGSNRRFSGFDQVFAINSDGWSEYRGATVALEHRPGGRLGVFGSYTFSGTEDNWVGARSGWADAMLAPFPRAAGSDWTEGRSDFDVPHRATLGGELRLGGAVSPRLAAVYRFRSGYPFTPGFRPGVDANGDGSARNDPAFLDPAVPGFGAVASTWSCLAATGDFAERNSCREDGVHSLDARVALDFLRARGRSASLVVDGFNLLSSSAGEPDRALYLVDPAGALQSAGGRVSVPLVANPNFGSPIARYATGRTLRIGFQVSY
ncbi:MAG TPA: carboxypeptidase-like regulatory domain-containing protein [Longimicrobiaceae bacterium]|nr:carboxypeptidase-like regulatory domain-containing protein [Longimicrobiaceae bacterium]